MTTALAVNFQEDAALLPQNGITSPESFAHALQLWASKNANVLTAETAIGAFDEDCQTSASVVRLDPDPNGVDCYHSKIFHRKAGEVSLTKTGLDKISQALSINWDRPRREDDRTIQDYWEVTVTGSYMTPSGEVRPISATASQDLRDGSAYIANLKPGQITAMRGKGLERCESIAKCRAIRSIGLPGTITQEVLKRPFVAVRTIVRPKDPETRRMLTLARAGALYPPAGAPARPIEVIDVTDAEPEPEPEPPAALPESTTSHPVTPRRRRPIPPRLTP